MAGERRRRRAHRGLQPAGRRAAGGDRGARVLERGTTPGRSPPSPPARWSRSVSMILQGLEANEPIFYGLGASLVVYVVVSLLTPRTPGMCWTPGPPARRQDDAATLTATPRSTPPPPTTDRSKSVPAQSPRSRRLVAGPPVRRVRHVRPAAPDRQVPHADVAVVGVPLTPGSAPPEVPGSPGAVREASRLLRPTTRSWTSPVRRRAGGGRRGTSWSTRSTSARPSRRCRRGGGAQRGAAPGWSPSAATTPSRCRC